MKKLFILTAAFLSLSGLALAAHVEPDAVQVEKAPLVLVGNKVCPVSGTAIPVEMMGQETVDYNGKVYNLCCAGCKGLFLADPDKYAKIAEREGSVPSAVAGAVESKPACPITGQKN